jgi:hypothetical protein
MAAFPSYGKLLLGGFSEAPASALIRTEMEGGLPKQAKVRARVMVTRAVAMDYSMSEFESFKVWFRDTIKRGADWFDWIDPLDGVTKLARIVAADPAFTAQPTTFSEGAPLRWTVKFNLETWDA